VGDIYDRQKLIENWEQERLLESEVAVIGSGTLAHYLLAAIAGLGIGKVKIFDNRKLTRADKKEGFLYLLESKHPPYRSKALEGMIRKINQDINVRGINWRFLYPSSTKIFEKENVIIDVTNDPISKSVVLEYGEKNNIPVILASADENSGKVYVMKDYSKVREEHLLAEYYGKRQGIIASGIIGGIICEEIRKILMPLDEEDENIEEFHFNAFSKDRFGKEEVPSFLRKEETENDLLVEKPEENPKEKRKLKDKYVFMVGAGALANFLALGLAKMGIGELNVVDYDRVDITNLNRQVLYYDSVGTKKVYALTEKLRRINRRMIIFPIAQKFTSRFDSYFRKHRPDLILDTVDNFRTRYLIQKFSYKYEIPLISGGTGPFSGQVVTYKPGETTCVNCHLDLKKGAEEEKKILEEYGCLQTLPSVVTSNLIIASVMLNEMRTILLPEIYGPPLNGVIYYNSKGRKRLSILRSSNICRCHEKYKGVK